MGHVGEILRTLDANLNELENAGKAEFLQADGLESGFFNWNTKPFEKNGMFVDLYFDKRSSKFKFEYLFNNRFNESWATFEGNKITEFQEDIKMYLTSPSETRPWLN